MRRLAVMVCVLLLWIAAARPSALARQDRAARLKEEAHKAFEVGRYDQAIRAFEQAYQVQRDPRLLYNLGLAYYKRFELKESRADGVQARDLFRRFLVLVPASYGKSAAERRKLIVVRRLAREYLAHLAEDLKRVEADKPSATASQPVAAPQTTHRADPPAPLLKLDRMNASPRRDPRLQRGTRTAERPRRGGRSRRQVLPWVLYGVGAATLTAATITGGLALGSTSDAEDAAVRRDVSANHRSADRADALALTTDVLIGCAVAAVATGVVFHLLGARSRARVAWSQPGTLLSLSLQH